MACTASRSSAACDGRSHGTGAASLRDCNNRSSPAVRRFRTNRHRVTTNLRPLPRRTPEVVKVYIGSFNADAPISTARNPAGKTLFEAEQAGLLSDLYDMPQVSLLCCMSIQSYNMPKVCVLCRLFIQSYDTLRACLPACLIQSPVIARFCHSYLRIMCTSSFGFAVLFVDPIAMRSN